MRSRKTSRNKPAPLPLGRLGFFLGLTVAVLATVTEALRMGHPLPLGLWTVQHDTPWLWILDALPVVLGMLGGFLSTAASDLRFTGKRGPLYLVAFSLIFLVPVGLMLFAYQENRAAVEAIANIRRAGELQTIPLQLYIRSTQRPGADLRTDLNRIATLRTEIRRTAPGSVAPTESAWGAFQREASRGKISLSNAVRLRESSTKLASAVERDAQLDHTQTAQMLLIGVVISLLTAGMTLQMVYQLRRLEEQIVASTRQQAQTNKQLEAANNQLEETNKRLEEANSQLERTAARDPITGLYNRRALDERLMIEWTRAVRYNEPITLVLIDLDHFKTYNDTFGHPAGDAVLKTIGALLQHGTRISDFPARYGGEEFVLILPHTDEEEAVRLSERLRAAIQAAPWKHRGITASFGVAERTDAMLQPTDLIDAADVALYQAKKTRNRVSRTTAPPGRLRPEDRKAA